MQIAHQDDRVIVFRGDTVPNRMVLALGLVVIVGASCLVADRLLVHDPPSLVAKPSTSSAFGILLAVVMVPVGGLSLWAGWFLALPFRLEVTRRPATARYAWRDWHVRVQSLETPLALVARPRRRKGEWRYELHVRTSSGDRHLLHSKETWLLQREAGRASVDLGKQVATFLGCVFEPVGWDTDPLTDTLYLG